MAKIEVQLVSAAEAETADYAVCILKGTPTIFRDNMEGVCHDCGRAVVFRPSLPAGIAKLCMECAVDHLPGMK